jgi:SAM-dependent methyltransferase
MKKRGQNPSRIRLEAQIKDFAASLNPGSIVLDAGAGTCLYRPLFSHVQYESADFGQVDKRYGVQTYVCRLDKIPVENERFDGVLMSQVLEHLEDPLRVLCEINRVLRSGSKLFVSAPLYYEEHEQPYDFYRYTQFGMRYLLKEAGFEVLQLDSVEGYFGTLSYQTHLAASCLPVRARDYGGGVVGACAAVAGRVARPILGIVSRGLGALEMRAKFTASGHCKNYYAIAKKVEARGSR